MRNERGVAMVTVLLVGAVLTVVSSSAAFMTIRELEASNDDLKATRALGYAEAGIDRALVSLREGDMATWEQVVLAGCGGRPVLDDGTDLDGDGAADFPELSGELGNGTYDVVVERDVEANPCPADDEAPDPREAQVISVISAGRHPDALRRVSQTVELKFKGLPIGLYAESSVTAGGNSNVTDVSLITDGPINGREKIGFRGFDPFYDVGDFYPDSDLFSSEEKKLDMPAAAHTTKAIKNTSGRQEHPPEPRCGPRAGDWNHRDGQAGQEVWDSSGTAAETQLTSGCALWTPAFGTTTTRRFPPDSHFSEPERAHLAPLPTLEPEDYEFLKGAAESTGLYCKFSKSGGPDFCTGKGTAPTSHTIGDGNLPADEDNFVVYIDSEPANEIVWQPDDFESCVEGAVNRAVVLVVRNGDLRLPSGAKTLGAIFVPEGTVRMAGSASTEGTIIAKNIEFTGGGGGSDDLAGARLSDCWIDNLSLTFIQVQPTGWRELDR